MLGEEVAVQLPNRILSSGNTPVNAISMLSNKVTSESDAVEIILINGDKLRGRISPDSWSSSAHSRWSHHLNAPMVM